MLPAVLRRLSEEVEGDALTLEHNGKAFALVIAAGLCTAVGAASVFAKGVVELATKPVLAIGLAFAAGVMIYVSSFDIFQKSLEAFKEDGIEEAHAYYYATLCTFGGMLLLRLLMLAVHCLDPEHDVIPEEHFTGQQQLPQQPQQQQQHQQQQQQQHLGHLAQEQDSEAARQKGENGSTMDPMVRESAKLRRMGLHTALAIGLHNAPEGLATYVAYLADETVGVALAIGIGFHNIPEGLCVALPIYYATGSRLKGFLWALLAGVSEPIGALVGYAVIKSSGHDVGGALYGVLFGLVGGMMIMISVLELFPTAFRYDPTDRFVTNSTVVGMGMIAMSLCLFQ